MKKTKPNVITRTPINRRKRFMVLERDGFRCVYCGITASEAKLEIDHIQPVSRGGTSNINNLAASCFDCNRGKRDHGARYGIHPELERWEEWWDSWNNYISGDELPRTQFRRTAPIVEPHRTDYEPMDIAEVMDWAYCFTEVV